MSDVDRNIKEILRRGNRTQTEVEKELRQSNDISHSTFTSHFTKLRGDEKILRARIRHVDDERPIIEYELVPEGWVTIEGQAKGYVAQFYDIAERYPTVSEVALEVGETPQQTEKILYATSQETGWHPPSVEEIKKLTKN